MQLPNIAIIGTPRSGSSYLTKLLVANGFEVPEFGPLQVMEVSQFNPEGYFESKFLNLLNDQLIRSAYGLSFSFLYPPECRMFSAGDLNPLFEYDLTTETVQLPQDYVEKITSFTGHDWDVWGLTRMQDGCKWNRVYERLGIQNHSGLIDTLNNFNKYLALNKGLVLKDSRLNFTLDLFQPNITKVIFLSREENGLKKSLRNHFGPRLFTMNPFSPFNWVSNHFNYAVGYMEFDEYGQRYLMAVEQAKKSQEVLEINLNSLDLPETLNQLSDYLEIKLERP